MSKDALRERACKLGLHGLLTEWDEYAAAAWLPTLLDVEEAERHRRSLERRLVASHIGRFKPMADFDWAWPTSIDREAVEELFALDFAKDQENCIVVGPNGIGKTMIIQNLAYQGVMQGHTVRFTTASALLNDLGSQDGSRSLQAALRRYCRPSILCIDEVGYLSYDNRYSDLLFEVVTRRYGDGRPIVITTNKSFTDWNEVFPNSGSLVTLVDRLIHRSVVVVIEGESYRLKEAKEREALKKKKRKPRASRE